MNTTTTSVPPGTIPDQVQYALQRLPSAQQVKLYNSGNFFDPQSTGSKTIALSRSIHEDIGGVREQINQITAYIDGSMVYGSDEARAEALRARKGYGKLKVSEGNLMPFNTTGLPNANSSGNA